MADEEAYGSPLAFRRALTDRLRAAASTSTWTLSELQRQFAYDRLLARLYVSDQGWIIKGAAALLARNLAVRATVDVDVYRHVATEQAEAELRVATARDLNDWFRFEIGPGSPMRGGAAGVRLPLIAYIGQTSWAEFKVDIVGADLRMTGTPDDVPPLAGIGIGDIAQPGYRAYPLVDHIADKIAAMLDRYGPTEAPSTRFKDLIDLFAIVSRSRVAANAQRTALQSEANRRGMTLPKRFVLEDRTRWQRGYAAEVKRSVLPKTHTLDDALEVVTAFIDPLLDGSATDIWNPETQKWA